MVKRLGDVRVHCSISAHKTSVKLWNKQTTHSFSNNQDISFQNKVARAEVIVSNFVVQHNLPMAKLIILSRSLKVYFQTVRLFHHIVWQ